MESDEVEELRGIGRVLHDGEPVTTAHYRLYQRNGDERWHSEITCTELPSLESLVEQQLVLELADGRIWHFTVNRNLDCVEVAPGLEERNRVISIQAWRKA